MRRQILSSFVFIFCFYIQVTGQTDTIADFTGVYQASINPSVEFIIKRDGTQLMLEVPGQGQINLLHDGGRKYHFREIPASLEFVLDTSGKPSGFRWTQRRKAKPAEWIKLAGQDPTVLTGRYRLSNNLYQTIFVCDTSGKLTSQVNDGPALALVPTAGEYRAKAGAYSISYKFIKDKSGHFTRLTTNEGGTLEFIRVKNYDVAFNGGFVRPNGFTRADTLRGMLSPLRSCYDVSFYYLDVEIFPYRKFIRGQNTIRFKAVEPFDRMQIDLHENMQIERIVHNGEDLSYTREYNAVFITFPKTVIKGTEDSITIYYQGKPLLPNITELKGGFLWYQDRDGNPWISSVVQGSGASVWWPCKDHLSDEPDSMKINITIPDNLVNISNGRLVDTSSLPGNRKKFEWVVSYPINNYNVAVNIGNYRHSSEMFVRETDSMQLHYYYLPYNGDAAKKIFGRTKELLSFFEKSFGEYPFKKDGFTLMESLYPMEHQSAVSIGSINSPLWSDHVDYKDVTRTMWHEAAHEWWGNNVSIKDMADLWVHEAFATYTEAMVMELFEGKDAMQKFLREQVPENKQPIIGSYNVNDFRLGDVYPKGCRMLHTLRNVIDNDSTWFALLRGLQQHFRYQTVTTDEFVSYINKTLRRDFTSFFDQYLRHAAIPELQLKFKQKDDDLEVEYRWKADATGFNMPVKVIGSNGRYEFVHPDTNWKTMTLERMKQRNFKVDTDGFFVKVVVL